jgi:uncharacterized OB-fold protein
MTCRMGRKMMIDCPWCGQVTRVIDKTCTSCGREIYSKEEEKDIFDNETK